jgi:hypothetical protein
MHRRQPPASYPALPLLQRLGGLADVAEQLVFENKLAFLVLLAALVRLVVLPPHRLFALSTLDVSHDVSARRHVALARLASLDVYDCVEEICFAVLAAEVSTNDVFMVGEVGFAAFAAVDAVAVEVGVVGETHDCGCGVGGGWIGDGFRGRISLNAVWERGELQLGSVRGGGF